MSKSEGVAEPSMDEILTSIRKIIAEDEVEDTDATVTARARGAAPERALAAVPDDADHDPAEAAADIDDVDDILELTEEDEAPGDDGVEAAGAADHVLDMSEDDDEADDGNAAAVAEPRTAATDIDDAASTLDAAFGPAAGDQADGDEAEAAPGDEAVDAPRTAATERAAVMMNEMTEVLLDNGAATAASGALQRLSAAVAPGEAVPQGHRTIEAFLADLVRPEIKSWVDEHLPALVERIVEREIKRLVRDAQPE